MKNKFSWYLIGILFFLMLLIFINSFYNDYQVYKKGIIVDVIITYVPEIKSSKTDNMKFIFAGKIYDKKVSSGFCDTHNTGENIKLKYLSGYEDNFLFPEESPMFIGVFGSILLASFSVLSFYYGKKGLSSHL